MTTAEPIVQSAIGAFDDPRYSRLAQSRASEYQSASGFSHIVLDSFLEEPLAHSLLEVFPEPESDVPWTKRDNANNRRMFLEDERFMPMPIRLMMRGIKFATVPAVPRNADRDRQPPARSLLHRRRDSH